MDRLLRMHMFPLRIKFGQNVEFTILKFVKPLDFLEPFKNCKRLKKRLRTLPEGVPVEFALLSILAAFGLSFGILYRALTLQAAGRSSSRSQLNIEEPGFLLENLEGLSSNLVFQYVPDLIWFGKYFIFFCYLILRLQND